jgi:phage terminase large subunit
VAQAGHGTVNAPRRVTIPYAPRTQQATVHADPRRFKVLVTHRRFGKTVLAVNELVKQASMCRRPQPRYAYMAPYLVQAKDIAWSYLKHYTAPIPDVMVNEAETWIELPGERRIRLYGADNADRLRGLYFDGVVMDEPAQMAPRVWAEIIRPALSDRLGWAMFIGTPMGRNAFCDLYEMGLSGDDPDWAAFMFKASETGIIPAAELDATRRAMTSDQYAQEFECSFDAAIPGAYYAELLASIEHMGRIKPVAYEPNLPVHTAWDLGINDPTAIWFFQMAYGEPRILDYYEMAGPSLEYHIGQLRAEHRAQWVYGMHLMPHDANVKELQTGMTRVQALKNLGVHVTVLPMLGVDDGISQARFVMRKCWFNSERCGTALKLLRQYRSEWDDKRQVLKPTPLHDFTSHCADAFRYLAVGVTKCLMQGMPLADTSLSGHARAMGSLPRQASSMGGAKPFGWRK